MPSSTYQGVILAAGQGSRMGPLSEHFPKALLPVANVPLIVRHLETLRGLGVKETFIVIGHLGERIRENLGDGAAFDMTLHYVEQGHREGLAHAVGTLESQLTGPFVLLLGDIYFDFKELSSLTRQFESRNADAVLAVKHEDDPQSVRKNFSVEMDADGAVRRVVEKPVEVPSLCKGCGLYIFSKRIFDAIRQTPRSSLRNEFELTDAIQVLIDDGAPVFGEAVVDWDVNVTTPGDLIACSRHVLGKDVVKFLVGQKCDLYPGTTLVETVLGDDVKVVQPCRLERCVVLPGTIVDSPTSLHDKVLYPD